MPDSVGTRREQRFHKSRVHQGDETRDHSRDKSMSKRVVTTATFTASNGRITGSNGDFTAFAVGDEILVQGSRLNNGFKTVTGIDGVNAAYVTVDPPPKDENAVAGTEVRAA